LDLGQPGIRTWRTRNQLAHALELEGLTGGLSRAIKTRTSDVEICFVEENPQVKYRQVSKGKIEAVKYCEPK
jgi:hypothetical protein